MKKYGLAVQILIALVLGIIVGAIFHGNEVFVKFVQPVGDIFLHLIKMIVVPIVVAALIVSIAGVGDIKKLGRLGGKTILYFEIVTTFAILFGLLVANVFQPGVGIHEEGLAKSDISQYEKSTEETKDSHGVGDILVHMVPTNVVGSMADGDLLPIIFFCVLFGLGVAAIGEKGKPVLSVSEGILETMFWVTNIVMKFAPFGVFAMISITVSKFGLETLYPLAKLVLLVYVTMVFFIVVILGIIAKIVKVNIFTLMKILKDELILAYSTASSESVMPRLMDKLEKFGCPKAITSFVIPTGYSFNLDGSTIYQSIACLFIAQMAGIDLSIAQQITLVLVLMLTSKGIAGVPGVSFVVIASTLSSMNIPIEGIAVILGVDRLMDMLRTVVNVVGNAVATIVVSKWEGEFDEQKSNEYISNIKKSEAA
ncbi:cation:dicarboxylate symporter family transporter [Niallia sp. 01092]|uniref:cation:dicarboxylate symporter family transporter n=1 Tax=unclassified Niallia TaxID=2837522 RepID=UPI003FD0A032